MKQLQIIVYVDSIEFGKADFIFFKKEKENKSYLRLEGFILTNKLALGVNSVFEVNIFCKNILYTGFDFIPLLEVNFINQETIELYTDIDPKHYHYNQDTFDILRKWDKGEPFNWRPLKPKAKRGYLQASYLEACLYWTGLPTQPIPYNNYVLDGAEIKKEVDFYCLLGEVFFGERGYFGQGPDGFDDCFSEIYSFDPHKPLVAPNTIVTINNSARVEKVLNKHIKKHFFYVIEVFEKHGFIVKLCYF